MNERSRAGVASLFAALTLGAYFGLYFLTAKYVDLGSNYPVYFVSYQLGPLWIDELAPIFEPARRFDDLFLRHRHGTVLRRMGND